MKKRPTLSNVAKIAGVTIMTVSRAVNDKPGVSEETRQKIIKIAKELDYQPNQVARGLATSQTSTIGLVVPDNTNPFFAQIARGVEDQAYELNYNIFLINSAEDPAREQKAMQSLWGKGVDGLISCSSRLPTRRLQNEVEKFSAVVLFNREFKNPLKNTISISLNDQRSGILAVDYLIKQGRRKIAFINGPITSISGQKRLEGYKLALDSANRHYDEVLVEYGLPDTQSGYICTQKILNRYPDIDSFYVFNDLMAVGVLNFCVEHGLRVPQDIAIVGNDDIPLASMIQPSLTTVHYNEKSIGRLIMRTLFDSINEENPPTKIVIEPELFVRQSA